MGRAMMKVLIMGLRRYYKNADKVESIIMSCSLTAAAATAAGAMIPAVAPVATIIGCAGTVWTMYIMICRELGIGFDKDLLKALASAVLTNIAVNLGSVIAVEIAACFIPGVSVALAPMLVFGVNYLAGVMFLNLLVKMLEHFGSLENLNSKEDLKILKKYMKMEKADARAVFSQSVQSFSKGEYKK